MAKPSCSPRLERLDLGKHALTVILVLLAVVIITGWMTTAYSNLKEDDTLTGTKEPVNVVVIADVDHSEAHNNVILKLFRWLRDNGVVEKVFFVKDGKDGPGRGTNIKTWWRKALRDNKVVKDGCVMFFPGPPHQNIPSDSNGFASDVHKMLFVFKLFMPAPIHPSTRAE